jgi:2-deoxy-D-gluconate 3-dehydrogenase
VPAYTAAKSGLAGLTQALANEWAPHNININATAALRADATRNQAMQSRQMVCIKDLFPLASMTNRRE